MSQRVFFLPGYEEMHRRLLEVDDGSDSDMQEEFCQILLRSAGRGCTAWYVVMMLSLAINRYIKGKPSTNMADLMHMEAPRFIDALLVDDPEFAEETKAIMERVVSVKREVRCWCV